jgi:predicted ATPase
MAIKKIRVTNFKSFKDLEVELGDLNILIGANASGKSNFVEIFRFLRDIEDPGLNDAISIQGVGYLRNVNVSPSEVLSLKIVSDVSDQGPGFVVEKEEGLFGVKACEATYEFGIEFEEAGLEFEIAEDRLTQKCDVSRLEEVEGEMEEAEKLGLWEFVVSCVKGKVDVESCPPPEGVPIKQDDIFRRPYPKVPPRTLLLETQLPLFLMPSLLSEKVFGDIWIYDFDPKLPKRGIPITGKAGLDEDGENLAIVLKNIIENEDEKRKFFNLATYLLPFVDDLDVETFVDGFLLFELRETYSSRFLPARFISDGTINMIALIIALYFEEESLSIIEEPERNIHPHLISKVVRMMEDASKSKQIVVTTHNPEMVKHADPKDILFVSRGKDGFSSISRLSEVSDKEKIKIFLENEIGIEELYVDNLLGI